MKFARLFTASLVPAGLALISVGCSGNVAVEQNAEHKARVAKPVAVKTVSVTQQDLHRSSVQPATVSAFYTAEIQAKVHGYIKEVKADIGDVVKAGDVLAIIDIPETEKQRQTAEALVGRQKAEEARATAGIELAKANVVALEALAAEARSKLQQAEATFKAAESEFRRTEDLVQRGSMQARVLDEVRERRDSAAAGKAAVTSMIQSALANVDVAKSELNAAAANLKSASADTLTKQREAEQLDELIKYATLKAPFTGVVTARNVSPGNLVTERSDADPLFVVSQLDKVRIHIPVPEKDAAFVDRGDQVSIVFPSFPAEEAITATVTRLTGILDPSTRTMLVEAEVANLDGKLMPGMFGQATITLGTKTATAMLPARAVRFAESGDAYVYVVSGETVSVTPVTTGQDDGNTIEITSGIQSGQTVIDAHLQRFTDGQTIEILQ